MAHRVAMHPFTFPTEDSEGCWETGLLSSAQLSDRTRPPACLWGLAWGRQSCQLSVPWSLPQEAFPALCLHSSHCGFHGACEGGVLGLSSAAVAPFGVWPELHRLLGPPQTRAMVSALGLQRAGHLALSSVP